MHCFCWATVASALNHPLAVKPLNFAILWTFKSDLNAFPSWSKDLEKTLQANKKKKKTEDRTEKAELPVNVLLSNLFLKLWYTQKTSFLKNAWYVGRRSVGWQLCSPTLKITISNNQDTTKNCTRRQQPGFVYTCKTSPMIYPITSICLTLFFQYLFVTQKRYRWGAGPKHHPF